MKVASIAENLYFTTVRIDTVGQDGTAGAGTGFLFSHQYQGNDYPFVVTNRHVIKGADTGGITFLKKDEDEPKLGEAFRIDFDDFPTHWYGHPEISVDIAVLPLAPLVQFMESRGVNVFFRTVSTENIPTADQLEEIDAFEEIVFVGYPNGIWDSKNYIPIMRKGTTATPVVLDYGGEKKFLIDASVFGGSSGSPVFIYQSGTYGTKTGGARVGTKFHFVGVVASVYFKTAAHEIVDRPIPTNRNSIAIDKEMIDLGIVWKAITVTEAIEAAVDRIGA